MAKFPNYTHEQLLDEQLKLLTDEKLKQPYREISDKIGQFILHSATEQGLTHQEACHIILINALRWWQGA